MALPNVYYVGCRFDYHHIYTGSFYFLSEIILLIENMGDVLLNKDGGTSLLNSGVFLKKFFIYKRQQSDNRIVVLEIPFLVLYH